MKNILLSFIFIPLISFSTVIQIQDSETKEAIPYASIHIINLNVKGAANENGKFEYNGVLPNKSLIRISALGYTTKSYSLVSNAEKIIIELKKSHIDLNEVIITSSTGILQQQNVANVVKKDLKLINNVSSSSLVELIANTPGVYNYSTGNGINKPVIRGLSGMKILTYLNGLRIDNQQWGGDHGISFDELGISTVEIIKGPSSLLYGADALGGVLYFSDENYTSPGSVESYLETKFESNSMGVSTAGGLKLASKNLRFNLFANAKDYADYQIPNGKYVTNSRYKGKSIKTAIGYNNNKWIFNIRYNFVSNRVGLPGHTHSANPELNDFLTTTQKRINIIPVQLVEDHYLLAENKWFFGNQEFQLLTGYTSNSITEHDEKVTIPEIKMMLNNYTYNLRYKRDLNNYSKLVLGFQGIYQKNKNDKIAPTSLIPDSYLNDNGVYSLVHWNKNSWESQFGLRSDIRVLNSELIEEKSFKKINGSFGIGKTIDHIVLKLNLSSGFRPPHLSELLSDGVHHATNRYEVGSTDLKSEIAKQVDVSIEYTNDHFNMSLNPFYNYFQNYIYIEPQNTEINGYPVYYFKQSEKVTLYGGEFYVHFHPHFLHQLHFEHDISYVFAEDQNHNPLPLIPQTRFNSNIKYEFKSKSKLKLNNIELKHEHYLKQNRVVDYESSSESYHLVHLGINFSYESKQPIDFKIGIRNLFNKSYINHLSNLKDLGIPGTGRNLYFSTKINLNY